MPFGTHGRIAHKAPAILLTRHTHTTLKLVLASFFCLIALCLSAQSYTREDCDNMIGEGVELMFEKKHTQSLELLVQAKAIAAENKWDKLYFLAENNIGANYYSMSDFGEAVSHYLHAYEHALAKLDEQSEMVVLNNIAILYFQEKNLDKANEYSYKAYEIAKRTEDWTKVGYYATNLALMNNKKGQLDEAYTYVQEAIPLLSNETMVLIQANIALAENHLLKGNYVEARRIAERILPQMDGIQQGDNRKSTLEIIARSYEGEENLAKALEFGRAANQVAGGLESHIEVMEYLSRLLAKSQLYDQALGMKDSVIAAKDSLNKIRNTRQFENGLIKFELQNYQQELAESQHTLQSERRLFMATAASVILIMIFVIWILRSNATKVQQRKKIVELELEKEKQQHLILEKQLREKEAIAMLEQERLKNELETKNRKLTAKALHLSSRNELIEEMIDSLSNKPEIAAKRELKKEILELKNEIKKDIQWDSFFTHFEEVNKGFLDRLTQKHPDLSSSEVRFITYVYMNLSNKEISSLLNITNQSCRKRKERLGKKLGIPENSSLFTYLSRI